MPDANPAISLERIDHGVLPSNDLGRAFRFWSAFMGDPWKESSGASRSLPMIFRRPSLRRRNKRFAGRGSPTILIRARSKSPCL